MAKLIQIHKPGEVIWTLYSGELTAWRVNEDGCPIQLNPSEFLKAFNEAEEAK